MKTLIQQVNSMKTQIRLTRRVLAEPSLNTGLHGSVIVMVDLHGSSANTENLLRIRSGPANRLKEHSSPHCKSLQTYKTMVEVTFNMVT